MSNYQIIQKNLNVQKSKHLKVQIFKSLKK